jgi:A/G-specific adenine glycosylase
MVRPKRASPSPGPAAVVQAPAVHPATAAGELVAWFRAAARDLPWRTDRAAWSGPPDQAAGSRVAEPSPGRSGPSPRRDPYRTWIAEIMLQQTQVSTVIAYYTRWMARFPDLPSLASAGEEEVLSLWAGLGYYSRARNLLDTARSVAALHGGILPPSRQGLLSLKGIGEYTAGAIASLAYNLPEPILDGNLVRVFSRLYGMDFLPDTSRGKKAYWDLAAAWVASAEPALVNEGLMELGALVCTPRSPSCESCPLARHCLARRQGRVEEFPPAKRRKEPKALQGYALVWRRLGRVLLYRPRKGELLAGLLTFPVILLDGPCTIPALRKAWAAAHPDLPAPCFRPRSALVTHGITHHQIRLHLAEAGLEDGAEHGRWPLGFEWVEEERVDAALVSSLPRKIWKAWNGARTSGDG